MAGLWAAASHAGSAAYNASPGWDTLGPLATEVAYQGAMEFGSRLLPEPIGWAVRSSYPAWRHLGRYGRPVAEATFNAIGRGARNYVRARLRPFLNSRSWRAPYQRSPFIRHPRMYARPVPEWQSRFVGFERRPRSRRVGRSQFFLSRDAWKDGFRNF